MRNQNKFFCIGNPVPLINLKTFKKSFFNQGPEVIPITIEKAQIAFEKSTHLIACTSMKDALALREAKMVRVGALKTESFDRLDLIYDEFSSTNLGDYVIYEIEIEEEIAKNLRFTQFSACTDPEIIEFIKLTKALAVLGQKFYGNDNIELLDSQICTINVKETKPQILGYHHKEFEPLEIEEDSNLLCLC